MENIPKREVSIRTFRHEDIVPLSAVDREAFGEASYPMFFLQQASDVFNSLFLIAEIEKEIVGYSLGAKELDSSRGWVLSLAVKKQYRRMGIAKKLTENLIHILGTYDIDEVYLTVDPNNTPAINLYTKLNFLEIRKMDEYFGPNTSRLIMCKKIDTFL